MRNIFKNKMWFMALLLVVAMTGCGSNHDDGVGGGDPGPAGAAPVLGTASTYGIFASSDAAVTLVDNSTGAGSLVKGDVGLMNGTGVCTNCVVPTSVTGAIHNGDTAAGTAQVDFMAAYTDASTRATNLCTVNTTELSVGQDACASVTPNPPGTLTTFGGVTAPTYGPGLYGNGSTIKIGVDKTIILDAGGNANAVFLFQAGSTITIGAGSTVLLANGAQAKNVFWVANAAVNIDGNSVANGTTFKGTAIANTAEVTVGGGTSVLPTQVEGRLFSHGAAVTVGTYATITVPAP
jgi:hypothetical protein